MIFVIQKGNNKILYLVLFHKKVVDFQYCVEYESFSFQCFVAINYLNEKCTYVSFCQKLCRFMIMVSNLMFFVCDATKHNFQYSIFIMK